MVSRAIKDIFEFIKDAESEKSKFVVRVSYLQIYTEIISDLLKPERRHLTIREDKEKGVFVENLSEWVVHHPSQIFDLLKKGMALRTTAPTKINDLSSRSHSVFIIYLENIVNSEIEGKQISTVRRAKLNLIDLAGSERVKVTGARGQRLEESKKINQSLSALGNVIFCLIKQSNDKRVHIPYRNSKLTRLLQDSLGGNCITTFMGMISPGQDNFSESFSTLKFANRTKKIKNKPQINEELDQELLIKKYEEELKRLRKVMADRRRGPGQSTLIQLEEEKERAEHDKNQMIRKLKEQSQRFMEEREEKRRLEMKINHLQSQLEVYKNLKRQFGDESEGWSAGISDAGILGIENQLKELEQQKAHLSQYKDLLRRQRDIMVALTNKLNERDEAIIQLQDELEAFDKIYIECEQLMLFKNSQLKFISKKLAEKGMSLDELLEDFEEVEKDMQIPSPNISQANQKEDLIQQNLQHLVFGDPIHGDLEKANPNKLKSHIDMIIEDLSGKKNPENLERVAKDLLGLQQMIGRLCINGEKEANLSEGEQRWSEKRSKPEVDMKQINYESLFGKAKLVRKETEDDINQFQLDPGSLPNNDNLPKKQTYENILSKFEEIKSSIMDFSKKNKQDGSPQKITKKVIKESRRPRSSAITESQNKKSQKQIRRQGSKNKGSFSSSRCRNKSFSSSKFENSIRSSARKVAKKGSFLTRKSGGFNEVNSKLTNILNNGKKMGYLENKFSSRGEVLTEKKVEGLLRENNILNMVPRVSNLK